MKLRVTHKNAENGLNVTNENVVQSSVYQDEEETAVNKDPFNISNDEYYNPRLANDAALKANLGITLLQVNLRIFVRKHNVKHNAIHFSIMF